MQEAQERIREKRDLRSGSRIPRVHSPGRLLLFLAVSIFLAETAIMAFLQNFPQLPPLAVALLDSGMLLLILFPSLLFFVLRPMKAHIRERRRAEVAIREERDNLKGILDSMEDGVYIVDSLHEVLYVNAALEREFGPVAGRKCHEYLHGRADACPWCRKDEVLAGNAMRWEWHSEKTGKSYDLFDSPIRTSDGTFAKLEIFHDITARKMADEATDRERRRLFALLDRLPALVSLLGSDRTVRFANRFFRDRFGEPGSKRCHELYHGRPDPCPGCTASSVLERGEEFEAETTTADGRSYRIHQYPFTDVDGTRLVLEFGIDVTERMRAERALRENQTLLRELLDSNPNLMFIRDENALLVLANQALARFYGVPPERLAGASQRELHAAAGMDPEQLEKSLREDREIIAHLQPLYTLEPYPHPGGGVRWYRTSRVPVVLADGTRCVQVLSGDITERVLAEESLRLAHERLEKTVEERTAELLDSNARLKRMVEEKSRAEADLRSSREQLRHLSVHLQSVLEEERTHIAREIHDEMGQSLTALRMDLSLIARKYGVGGNDELAKRVESAALAVDGLLKTVKRIAVGLRPGVLDEIGLPAAIEWQAREFADRTGIPCGVTVEPAELEADPERSTAVFRIFQESLTNVVRHAKASRVDVILERREGRIMLEVRDDGIGLDAGRRSDTASLGLLGIRERVRAFGGNVEIEGASGQGTTIRISLPTGEG